MRLGQAARAAVEVAAADKDQLVCLGINRKLTGFSTRELFCLPETFARLRARAQARWRKLIF
jgi:hypothetical protein